MTYELIVKPSLGCIEWKFKNGNTRVNFGRDNGLGYRQVQVNGRLVYLHRFIWQFVNGSIPDDMQIDHIDGDKSNNKLDNLRLVTKSQNMQNQHRSHRRSKTGVKGVWFDNSRNHYVASISVNKTRIKLGSFSSIDDAAAAYSQAAATVHTHNPYAQGV